jgi:hypothetical protein
MESEKSTVVRDYRDLLVQIHQYLAWSLQVDVEANGGAGHIAEPQLRGAVREFLQQKGHPTEVVAGLFTGVVERVGALVSRVQGTYEFEVQPLREYFAARYLHDTAPYDPTGRPQPGTLPDRFAAIAKNFFWLNATRFYAGRYSSGELASLLVGLEEIGMMERFRHISHIPMLSTMFLSDYVFSQQPRLAAQLAWRIVGSQSLRLLLATRITRRSNLTLAIPAEPARSILTGACKGLLKTGQQSDTISATCGILSSNCSLNECLDLWRELRAVLLSWVWIEVGGRLSVFDSLPYQVCAALMNSDFGQVASELVSIGRIEAIEAYPGSWSRLVEVFLDQALPMYLPGTTRTKKTLQLLLISSVFCGIPGDNIEGVRDEIPLFRLRERLGPTSISDERGLLLLPELADSDLIVPKEILSAISELSTTTFGHIKRDATKLLTLLELARQAWGERWALYRSAVDWGQVTPLTIGTPCSLSDSSVPLVSRIAYARQRASDAEWWATESRTASAMDPQTRQFIMYAAYRIMSLDAILSLGSELGCGLDGLPEPQWLGLTRAVSQDPVRGYRPRRKERFQSGETLPTFPLSARVTCFVVLRLDLASACLLYDRYLSQYDGKDRGVLQTVADLVTRRAVADAGRWAEALPVIARAYACNVISPTFYHVYARSRRPTIPLSVAETICSDASDYPLFLVSDAEAVLAAQAGKEATPVGRIAERDQWFTDQ